MRVESRGVGRNLVQGQGMLTELTCYNLGSWAVGFVVLHCGRWALCGVCCSKDMGS